MFLHVLVFGIIHTVVFLLPFSLQKCTNVHSQHSLVDFSFLDNHQVQQIFERYYIVSLQQTRRVFMESHDSLSYDRFEAGSVDGVLLNYGIDCAEHQQFGKDTELV